MYRENYVRTNMSKRLLHLNGMRRLLLVAISAVCIIMNGNAQRNANEKLWDVKISEGTLLQAIRQVESVTQEAFSYNASSLNEEQVAATEFRQQSLATILRELLNGKPYVFRKSNGVYLIAAESNNNTSNSSLKSWSTVKGQVRSAAEPLSGVTVNETGTSHSSVTDGEGRFTLNVSNLPAQLTFSFVGHQTETITFADTSFRVITLNEAMTQLEDVVVTALNVKRESKELGYVVEKIKGDDVNEVKTVSISSALGGKIPGLNISNTANGVAGSKRVTLRGISSITGNNQPLWVVDGIPINTSMIGNATPDGGGGLDYGDGLTGLNTDDIESISVLKGNAAAALYGSRASNGVILITTKSGRDAKKKTEVSFHSTFTLDKAVDLTDWQYEYGQGVNGKKPQTQQEALLGGNAGWGEKLDGSDVIQYDGVARPYSPHRNNFTEFYKGGQTWTNSVAISGHYENHNYRISASHVDNKDIVPNTSYSRNNFSIHSESRFGNLSVNVVADFINEKAQNRQRLGGNYSNVHYTLINLPSNINVSDLAPGYDALGKEIGINNQGIPTNPYYTTNKIHQDDERRRFIGSLELKYDITPWLYAKGRMMADYLNFKELDYTPNGVIWYPKGGGLNQDGQTNSELNYEGMIGTAFSIAQKAKVNAFAGGNIYKRNRESFNINGSPFVIDDIYTANNLAVKYPSTGYYRKQTNSLFASAEVSYDDLLFLNFTGRQDWFSSLPVNNNSLFYPSVSLSYLLSRHLSMPSWISFAKLRGSFAEVSGDTDPYQLTLGYSLDRDNYNGINLQKISNSVIPNVNLQPLLSSEIEFGTDLGFVNDRINVNLTYYNRKTTQDIVVTQVSNSSGFAQAILNVGEIANKGFEAAIKTVPVRSGKFKWEVNANFSYNDNKVVSLGGDLPTILLVGSKTGSATINVEKGKRYGMIEGYTYLRDSKGAIVYDANGYPMNSTTPQILGNGLYDKIAGISNTFSYGPLSLYFLIDGKFGADIYSEQNSLAVSNGKHKMTLAGRESGLTGNGVDAQGNANSVVVPVDKLSQYYGRVAGITENFVYDASFAKLREVSLGYQIPKKLLAGVPFSRAYVSLIARNLLILYKNTPNIDPESGTISGNAQGISATVYPTTRSYGVNLSLNF